MDGFSVILLTLPIALECLKEEKEEERRRRKRRKRRMREGLAEAMW